MSGPITEQLGTLIGKARLQKAMRENFNALDDALHKLSVTELEVLENLSQDDLDIYFIAGLRLEINRRHTSVASNKDQK